MKLISYTHAGKASWGAVVDQQVIDLAAARGCGLMTAHIDRPMEYGGARAPDADAAQDWEYSADSLTALAAQLEC